MTKHSSGIGRSVRDGVALMSVLYFLVVCGLAATALLLSERSRAGNVLSARNGARLSALADSALYSALAEWKSVERLQQPVGSTIALGTATTREARTSVFVTRTTGRLYSILAEANHLVDRSARRVSLLVRLPLAWTSPRAALVSAVDVTVGAEARIVADTTCGDTTAAAIVLSPTAALSLDSTAAGGAPSVARAAAAADSATYLQFGDAWWNDLAAAADVRLANGAQVAPMPVASAGSCVRLDANWGDPSTRTSACGARAPIVYAAGDLTIEGGLGQGALLVEGHLLITGAFTYSGQIVARGGIEMRADNIAITGSVHAWRARGDTLRARADTARVVLARRTTLRYSGCDAWYGVASWLQPRRVREYAWTELF